MGASQRDRTFGVLLHPSSLPGREDVGTLGRPAYRFVDWLASTGATTWQILPLTPNGQYDSPYFSYSAFATNPWLVDLELLQEAGLLVPRLNDEVTDARIPFTDLDETKLPQLVTAARAFLATPDHPWQPAFEQFRATQHWLADTALFRALSEVADGAPWWEWPQELRTRDPVAIATAAGELAPRIALWEALFFFGDVQWNELKAYANAAGLQVLGDLPIYVTHDSADVWLHQDQFQLGADGRLLAQSGVPPDYFSETGQLWGNPLYRWDRMTADGFSWWVARLRRCLEQADVVRIDHFRALAAYWRVPADAPDARGGEWVDGPGQAFMDVLAREFPGMPFVAEDLGTLDDDVLELRDRNRLPGMRILQFGFDGTPDNPHLPHAFPEQVLVYTGTHDNEPISAWWRGLDEPTKAQVAEYYQFRPTDDIGHVVWSFVEAAFGSRARTAVFPVQDLLVLDERSRMNDPSVFVDNWSWRMPPDGTSHELAQSLHRLAQVYGRLRG